MRDFFDFNVYRNFNSIDNEILDFINNNPSFQLKYHFKILRIIIREEKKKNSRNTKILCIFFNLNFARDRISIYIPVKRYKLQQHYRHRFAR